MYKKMPRKTIKLSPEQLREVIEEGQFSYLGNGTTDTNQNSEVMVNLPYDNSEDLPVEPTQANKISHTLSNASWWNRHYGFNGYSL